MTDWISVKDKLPDDARTVLVYDTEWGVRVDFLDFYYGHGEEFFTYGHVAHWQPLPEPPKQKSGENE